jgi:hypothetical protein
MRFCVPYLHLWHSSSSVCHQYPSCIGSIGNASISNSSCLGVVSCALLTGLTLISSEACDGVDSCTGLNSSVIGEFVWLDWDCRKCRFVLTSSDLSPGAESCVGDGTCSCCNRLKYCVTAPNGKSTFIDWVSNNVTSVTDSHLTCKQVPFLLVEGLVSDAICVLTSKVRHWFCIQTYLW